MDEVYRSYTGAERRKRTWLVLRGAKQAIAGTEAVDPRFDRQIDRIDARAADRGQREALALVRQDETARNDLATARARERAARGTERATAREERRKAERRVRDTGTAMRRAGL